MGKVLREGYTTGATATVAMKAAVLAIKGEFPKQVTVLSPQRTEITLPVQSASAENNIGTATVLKDAGDDLDCTNGTPIVVTVELTDKSGMELRAGKGVGTVISDLCDGLAEKGISLEVTDAAKNVVLDNSYKKEYGARPMRRYIESHIEDALAQKLIRGELKSGDTAVVSESDGKLKIEIK